MTAISLIARINQVFGVEISFKRFFETPVIGKLAEWISLSRPDVNQDHPYIIFNNSQSKRVFAFPPGQVPFGIVYSGLAKILDQYSIYAFNYIEVENKINTYVDLITSIQPNGPYVLFGYSAGGNLAFEVAKELDKLGHEVSDIIMLDVVLRFERIENANEDLTSDFEEIWAEFIKNFSNQLSTGIQFLHDQVLRKWLSYHCYLNETVNSGMVGVSIHLIESPFEKEHGFNLNEWEMKTSKEFLKYHGFGEHYEMLEELVPWAKCHDYFRYFGTCF